MRVALEEPRDDPRTVDQALDLGDGNVCAELGQDRAGAEAVRVDRRELGDPVVVDLHHREMELRVLVGSRELGAGVGEEDLGIDPIGIEVEEARLGVVRPGCHVGQQAWWQGRTGDDPEVSIRPVLDVRDPVRPLLRCSRLVEVPRLGHVPVGRDQPDLATR